LGGGVVGFSAGVCAEASPRVETTAVAISDLRIGFFMMDSF
jgi:hypothetical protein